MRRGGERRRRRGDADGGRGGAAARPGARLLGAGEGNEGQTGLGLAQSGSSPGKGEFSIDWKTIMGTWVLLRGLFPWFHFGIDPLALARCEPAVGCRNPILGTHPELFSLLREWSGQPNERHRGGEALRFHRQECGPQQFPSPRCVGRCIPRLSPRAGEHHLTHAKGCSDIPKTQGWKATAKIRRIVSACRKES